MDVLNYKDLKKEFKKKNFIRFKELKKKRKVIDCSTRAFKDKNPVNDKYWEDIVKRADSYKKASNKRGLYNIKKL